MTDYIQREIETDELIDALAQQRDRVTALPDEPNDIPINEAVQACQRISSKSHEDMRDIEAIG